MTSTYEEEVASGQRFKFGKNWERFLSVIDDERIAEAEKSIKQMLGLEDLQGKSFLDIGSGSGLFSLAACRLRAKVYSFDYDPQSVACTQELRRRYLQDDPDWIVESGSVLDLNYLKSLGQFDIVYSWGVLHHTGAMWQALENITPLVTTGGKLFIAIYNDQSNKSHMWRKIKQVYCSGIIGKTIVSAVLIPYFIGGRFVVDILKRRNPVLRYREKKKSRGMSVFHDLFDWLGGLPFEVAKPEEIFKFYHQRGFVLENLVTCGGGLGNNQFVFVKK